MYFLCRFSKNTQISNFMKIIPVGAELFHANGRTDGRTDRQADRRTNMTKLTVAFGNFANAPKNEEVNVTGSGSFPYGKLYC